MLKQHSAKWLFFLVLLTGAILRFWNFHGWSLTNDELSAMARLRFEDFGTMIRQGVMLNDMHPPGVQAFLWFWTHIFGTSQTLYRLPFVIMGVVSLGLFYQIGFRWFGEQASLAATSVFSGLSFFVLYSQLARPYSAGVFFALLFVLAWTELLIRNERTVAVPSVWYKVLFVVAGAGCMYTHYFCFLFAGLVGLSGFFFISNRKSLLQYLLLGAVMVLLFLPALPVALHQFSIGGLGGPEGWLGPPGEHAIREFLFYAFNESYLLVILLVVVFLLGLRKVFSGAEKKLRLLALGWSLTPVLIAYYYSIFVNPVFQYSILIFGFPYLLLFLTAGFSIPNKLAYKASIAGLLLVSVLTMIMGQQYYSKAQFAVFKEIAELTKNYSDRYGKDSVERTINVIAPFYIHYYLDPVSPGMNFSLYKCTSAQELRMLDSLVQHTDADYFLHAWSNLWHAPETEQIIRDKFPYLTAKDSFFNAGILLFSRDGTKLQLPEFSVDTMNTFETVLWNNDAQFRSEDSAFSGRHVMRLRPANEYSSGIDINALSAGINKGSTIEADVMINASQLGSETMMVISVSNKDGAVFWRSRPLKDFVTTLNQWQHFYFAYTVQENILPDDKLSVYIWNNGKSDLMADDFRIRIR
jgi:hypothetical protein